MNIYWTIKNQISRKMIAVFVLLFYSFFNIFPYAACAQDALTFLPPVGEMVHLSRQYHPPIIQGIKIFAQDPFRFDFIIHTGDVAYQDDTFKAQADTLIKYFLTTLTIPKDDLWVNLSPQEENRIVPNSFGFTEMGKDLLAQDYVLKQLTSSLLYPEQELGESFWDKIYTEAREKFQTTDIPVETINKVWIVPERVVIYENGDTAYITESKLKVLLEEDYLKTKPPGAQTAEAPSEISSLTSDILRNIIIPAVEKEVNTGAHFAQLRQIYHSMVLATWYKRNLKQSIFSRIYVEKNKINGVDVDDTEIKEKIYQQYLEAFRQGVYNYVKEDYDHVSQQVIPRKYFSGGAGFENLDQAMLMTDKFPDMAAVKKDKLFRTSTRIIVRPLADNKGVILLEDPLPEQRNSRAPPRQRLMLPAPGEPGIVTSPIDDLESQPLLDRQPTETETAMQRINALYNLEQIDEATREKLRTEGFDVFFRNLSPAITLPENVNVEDVRRLIETFSAHRTEEQSDLVRRYLTDSFRINRSTSFDRIEEIQSLRRDTIFTDAIQSIVMPAREIIAPNLFEREQFSIALNQRPLIGGDQVLLGDIDEPIQIDDFQSGSTTKTFGLEFEFQIADQDERFQRRAMNPADLWQPKWSSIIRGLKNILDQSDMDWVLDSTGNYANFQEFKIGGQGVTHDDISWSLVEATLEQVQQQGGPLQGGVSSVHLHYGYKNARRNSDGTLVCDQKRFGRVVKIYEAMFRALGGRRWTRPSAGYVQPLDDVTRDRQDLGGGKTEHNRILNLSYHGTIEAKFFEGDVSTTIGDGQKVDEKNLRHRTQWGFNLLDFVRSGYDKAPLAILGIPVLAGHKPSQKQVSRFIELFFEPGSEEAAYARETFEQLSGQEPGHGIVKRREQLSEMENHFRMFGLSLIWNRHMAHDGYDESLAEHFLMLDVGDDVAVKDNERILSLAMDLIKAGNTDERALGYFPIDMHEKLQEALDYIRESKLVKKEDIKEIDPDVLDKIEWADIFNTANINNLSPEMDDYIISRSFDPEITTRVRVEPQEFYYVPQNENLRVESDRFETDNITTRLIRNEEMRLVEIDMEQLKVFKSLHKKKSRLTHFFLVFMLLSLFLVGDIDRNTQDFFDDKPTQEQVDEEAIAASIQDFQHMNILSRRASGEAVDEYRRILLKLYSADVLVDMLNALKSQINNVTGNLYEIDFDNEPAKSIVSKGMETGTPYGVNLERVTIAVQHELGLREDGDVGKLLRETVIEDLRRKAIEDAIQRRLSGPGGSEDARESTDKAQLTARDSAENVGGIDFNADYLYIDTNGIGVQLSVPIHDIELRDVNISGVTPLILDVAPVTNLLMFLGVVDQDASEKGQLAAK